VKTVITITGIRPDFIRMSEIFKKLDKNFNHILIHSGQHYDTKLSLIFFKELNIRIPDYNLNIGGPNKEHFEQTGELSIKLIKLIRDEELNPDLIIFLGDSNSVVSSIALKKEGYKIAHIEAGMRSGDKRMLEEINRMVCDTCSDFLFVYHENYKNKLKKENIKNNVYVVGNTIVEIINKYKPTPVKVKKHIILDIHRPENFNNKNRLENIVSYSNSVSYMNKLPIYLIGFPRTLNKLKEFNINLGNIKIIELLSFKKYLKKINESKFIISDSGTAQEEPALLGIPVIVPRDFTERPESIENNCSFMIDVNTMNNSTWCNSMAWLKIYDKVEIEWLGDGKTSDKIINIIKNKI